MSDPWRAELDRVAETYREEGRQEERARTPRSVRLLSRLLRRLRRALDGLHRQVSAADVAIAPHRPVELDSGWTVCLPCNETWPCPEWIRLVRQAAPDWED